MKPWPSAGRLQHDATSTEAGAPPDYTGRYGVWSVEVTVLVGLVASWSLAAVVTAGRHAPLHSQIGHPPTPLQPTLSPSTTTTTTTTTTSIFSSLSGRPSSNVLVAPRPVERVVVVGSLNFDLVAALDPLQQDDLERVTHATLAAGKVSMMAGRGQVTRRLAEEGRHWTDKSCRYSLVAYRSSNMRCVSQGRICSGKCSFCHNENIADQFDWLVACLTSQQHASVSQGRISSDKFT